MLHLAHNLSKDKGVKARMHELHSIVINYEKFEKKTDFFNALAGLYIHVLNVEYLANKFDSFLRILHALYRYMEKERKEFDKVDICKEILNI